MKRRVVVVTAIIVASAIGYLAGLWSSGYLVHAEEPLRPADKAWNSAADKELVVMTEAQKIELALLEGKKPEGISRQPLYDLVEAYRLGIKDPDSLKGLLARSLNKFEFGKAGAKSAAQVSQLADEVQIQLSMIEIEQNQRIISLLEQMAAK